MPSCTSLSPMRKSDVAPMRTSACSASTHPPAIACPFTAATTGMGSSKMRSIVREKPDMNAPIACSSSASSAGRSSPAEKNPS